MCCVQSFNWATARRYVAKFTRTSNAADISAGATKAITASSSSSSEVLLQGLVLPARLCRLCFRCVREGTTFEELSPIAHRLSRNPLDFAMYVDAKMRHRCKNVSLDMIEGAKGNVNHDALSRLLNVTEDSNSRRNRRYMMGWDQSVRDLQEHSEPMQMQNLKFSAATGLKSGGTSSSSVVSSSSASSGSGGGGGGAGTEAEGADVTDTNTVFALVIKAADLPGGDQLSRVRIHVNGPLTRQSPTTQWNSPKTCRIRCFFGHSWGELGVERYGVCPCQIRTWRDTCLLAACS